jgi:hypothetical protein
MSQWGRRKHSDQKIRQIVALGKVMPHCEATYRELARRFDCGFSTVEKIVGGWILPKGIEHENNRSR